MKKFTGYEYLQIDLANQFGLDKEVWSERLSWVHQHEAELEGMEALADSPVLFRKAVRAYRKAQKDEPIRHVVGLDATASGLQCLAVLTGCLETAKCNNLTDTGNREDVYRDVATEMSKELGQEVSRTVVKKPIMTHYYQSTATPKRMLGEDSPELKAFYKALNSKMPGAEMFLGQVKKFWNPKTKYYQWTMPDGHVVKFPVLAVEKKRIEVDEMDHFKFNYQTTVVKQQEKGRSLAANIVHSVDAYICRKMVRMAHEQGFQLLPVHDCYYAHPNYLNQVRENYINIMASIAESHLLEFILEQLGHKIILNKNNISAEVLHAEYPLS